MNYDRPIDELVLCLRNVPIRLGVDCSILDACALCRFSFKGTGVYVLLTKLLLLRFEALLYNYICAGKQCTY